MTGPFTATAVLAAWTSAVCVASACSSDVPGERDTPEAAPRTKASESEPRGPEEATRVAPTTGTGTLRGTVAFTGPPPERALLERKSDPVCDRTAMRSEEALVQDGKLQNVLVRLSTRLRRRPRVTAPATLDQVDCMFRPRVQAIVRGQKVLIENSDPTLHNVHAYVGTDTLFNRAQIQGAPPFERRITKTGVIVKFKCDVHPWMAAYLSITDHPWFAVTGPDGSFEIRDIPSGRHTLEAWHERFGTKEEEVEVQKNGVSEVTFSYDGSESG